GGLGRTIVGRGRNIFDSYVVCSCTANAHIAPRASPPWLQTYRCCRPRPDRRRRFRSMFDFTNADIADQVVGGNYPRRHTPTAAAKGVNHDEDSILDLGERTRAKVAAGGHVRAQGGRGPEARPGTGADTDHLCVP